MEVEKALQKIVPQELDIKAVHTVVKEVVIKANSQAVNEDMHEDECPCKQPERPARASCMGSGMC